MKVDEIKQGEVLVMALEGRLDAETSPAFQDRLLAAIDGSSNAILLDFSALHYISSAGLRVLLIAAKRLRERDGSFALCSLSSNIQEIFKVSGFDAIIKIHGDRAKALEAMSS
jgi:anti-sigma B factor antagonist